MGARTGTADGSLGADRRLLAITTMSVAGTFGPNVVSPALPALATAFSVSDATVALAMTVYTLPQIALILLLGMAADTYGRRRVILPALVVFGGAGVAISVAGSFTQVLGLRVLQGMVAGGVIPLAITVVGDLYSGARGSSAQGIRLAGNSLSSIVVPATAGLLAGYDWRWAFALFLFAFPAAALGYRYLPETGGRRGDGLGVRAELSGYLTALRGELRNPSLAVLLLGGFVQGLAWYALLTFLPLFVVRGLGATAFAAGAALAMRGASRILIGPFTGRVLGVVSRRTALAVSISVSAAGIALIPLAPSAVWAGAAVALFGLGDAFFTPIHRDSTTQLPSAESRAGVVTGMVVLFQVGTTISPVLFGAVLAAAGFGPVFWLAAAAFLGYGVVVAVVFGEG